MPRILIITICIGLTVAVGALFLWPKYQNYQNLQTQIGNKNIELENQNAHYENLIDLSEKLQEFDVELEAIDIALPSNASYSAISFYNYLQKASSENGLIVNQIGSFALSPLVGRGDIQEMSLSVGVSGSYSAFKNFLRALEKSARIIEVESISFSFPGEDGLFSFQIEIKTHSY